MLHDPSTGRFVGPSETAEQRFWKKVHKTDSCWIWTAAKNSRGYGSFWDGERLTCAHRFSYEIAKGMIDSRLELDHLCRNPSCVNPDHLEPVDHRMNMQRGITGLKSGAQQRAKTHCPQGHPYDETNTYINPTTGARHCKICKSSCKKPPQKAAEQTKRYRERRKMERLAKQADRHCQGCDAPIPTGRSDRRFCSRKCFDASR